jgi:uncharacterized protein (UPF0332 family)
MHSDLIALATKIVELDPKRPRQANLLRAVSTAYYAVFHYLIDEACCVQIGTQNSQKEHRYALARAFAHTSMKDACKSFNGGTLKEAIIKGMPRDENGHYPIPVEIRDIAGTFVELQEMRHQADYDLSEQFRKADVLKLIEQAKSHIEKFQALAVSDTRKFFLACLWAYKELKNR